MSGGRAARAGPAQARLRGGAEPAARVAGSGRQVRAAGRRAPGRGRRRRTRPPGRSRSASAPSGSPRTAARAAPRGARSARATSLRRAPRLPRHVWLARKPRTHATRPATRVKRLSEFSIGCRWPSSFSVTCGRRGPRPAAPGPRPRALLVPVACVMLALAASGTVATPSGHQPGIYLVLLVFPVPGGAGILSQPVGPPW